MRLHVMNRSADPVTGVTLRFIVREADRDFSAVGFEEWLSDMAPCTEVIYEMDSLRSRGEGADWEKVSAGRIVGKHILFTDHDGRDWVREEDDLLIGAEAEKAEDDPFGSEIVREGKVVALPIVKRAASCGSESGPAGKGPS
ncbi:hypothetical protein ACFWZY_32120 [Streptomyces sp. NPDC058992]|uniref:hypothetical protein n=1 Tax=Streptomyces sp. NPDC058992 TaxID=3346688 RepID=UPI0036A72823